MPYASYIIGLSIPTISFPSAHKDGLKSPFQIKKKRRERKEGRDGGGKEGKKKEREEQKAGGRKNMKEVREKNNYLSSPLLFTLSPSHQRFLR